MPHLILEHSANVALPGDPGALLGRCHDILHRTGGIALDNCKGRIRVAESFCVGGGEPDGAFVHLEVRFLEGRSDAVRAALGEELLALLVEHFAAARESLALQITVETGEIRRAAYHKDPPGTLGRAP